MSIGHYSVCHMYVSITFSACIVMHICMYCVCIDVCMCIYVCVVFLLYGFILILMIVHATTKAELKFFWHGKSLWNGKDMFTGCVDALLLLIGMEEVAES